MVPSTSHLPYFPSHGNASYRVEHYDLSLDYRVSSNRLGGTARLSAVAIETLSRLSLDLGTFRVGGVLVNGKPVRFTHRGGKLHLAPGRLTPGPFTVEVRYAGAPARPPASGESSAGSSSATV
ncbi:hypothetical protein ACFQX6_65420 [Streptosporangium lutulentum]